MEMSFGVVSRVDLRNNVLHRVQILPPQKMGKVLGEMRLRRHGFFQIILWDFSFVFMSVKKKKLSSWTDRQTGPSTVLSDAPAYVNSACWTDRPTAAGNGAC